MATTTAENMALSSFGGKLKKMEEELAVLNKHILQEQLTFRLEDLCTMLKSAVIDFNLKLPPLVSFERYLRKLTNIDDVFYVMDLVHQCWVYLHPTQLFDRSTKSTMSQEEMLDRALSKYSGTNPNPDYDFINQEVDRHNISELTIFAANSYNKMDSRYKNAYSRYMDGLLEICKSVCKSFDIELGPDFTIDYVLTTKTNLTSVQIDNVFKAVANDGKMNNDQDTAAAFRSLFNQTTSAVEQRIQWLDVSRSQKPNYASLYIMFKTMGVDMNKFHRTIICKVFTTRQGPIDPDQLKSRESNDSDTLKTFETLVSSVL